MTEYIKEDFKRLSCRTGFIEESEEAAMTRHETYTSPTES
jgi:hypothetical protein